MGIGKLALSLVTLAILIVAATTAYLAFGANPGSTTNTTGLCCPPDYGVFQPDWREPPVYNVSSQSLPQVLKGAFSINVSEPYQIRIDLSGARVPAYFGVNITVVVGGQNSTYMLLPSSSSPTVPSAQGKMTFTYVILVREGTTSGMYQFDIGLNPMGAPHNYVGTQFPLIVQVD